MTEPGAALAALFIGAFMGVWATYFLLRLLPSSEGRIFAWAGSIMLGFWLGCVVAWGVFLRLTGG